MTAKPLSHIKNVANISFAPGSVGKRPKLAPHVMHVIELWSFADARLLFIGRHCLGGNAFVSTAMMQSIDSQTAQRAMVLAGVKQTLPASKFKLFDAAFHTTLGSRKVRHQFAHHYWGTSDDLPDALLIQDPKHAHNEMAARIQLGVRTTVSEIDRSTIESPRFL